MLKNICYVRYIDLNRKIVIRSSIQNLSPWLKSIEAKNSFFDRTEWIINCKNESDFLNKLQSIQNREIPFMGGSHGWNPADIFILLRERNKLQGAIIEITWKSPTETIKRIL